MGFGTPREEKPVVVDVPARLVTLAKGATGLPDIRQFDVASINDAIDRQIATMRPDENVLGYVYVDKDGANLAVVGKLKKLPGRAAWTVYGKSTWDGDWTAGAALRWSDGGWG